MLQLGVPQNAGVKPAPTCSINLVSIHSHLHRPRLQTLLGQAPGSGEHMDTTAKTLMFWLALLVTAALLYGIVVHRTLQAVTPTRVSVTRKVEYSMVPVEPSSDALREALE